MCILQLTVEIITVLCALYNHPRTKKAKKLVFMDYSLFISNYLHTKLMVMVSFLMFYWIKCFSDNITLLGITREINQQHSFLTNNAGAFVAAGVYYIFQSSKWFTLKLVLIIQNIV